MVLFIMKYNHLCIHSDGLSLWYPLNIYFVQEMLQFYYCGVSGNFFDIREMCLKLLLCFLRPSIQILKARVTSLKPMAMCCLMDVSTPSIYWCMRHSSLFAGLCISPCQLLEVPLRPFFQPVEAAQQSGLSITPLISVSPTNLLKVHPAPALRSLMKTLSGTGPSTDPWGTS